MSFNGSGTYTLPGSPLNTGDVVSATENNSFRNDVAGAFNKALCRDGQAVPTANLPMGNFKLTGLAAGTNAGDSVRYEQVTTAVAVTGGTIANTTMTNNTITGGSVSSLTTDIAIADGGTGASTAANARTNLGLGGLAILNTVGTAQIDNLAVGTAQIANNAVTTGKLASSAVTATELASDAVTTIKILNANVTPAKLSQPFTTGTVTNTTSGTTAPYASIPSWVKRITMFFNGVSTNGTSNLQVQIGTGGVYTTTGYNGASADGPTLASSQFTTGFGIRTAAAAATVYGSITIYNITGNTWVASGNFARGDSAVFITTAGAIALAGVLDCVRLTTVNGTDAFDAGSINISYE